MKTKTTMHLKINIKVPDNNIGPSSHPCLSNCKQSAQKHTALISFGGTSASPSIQRDALNQHSARNSSPKWELHSGPSVCTAQKTSRRDIYIVFIPVVAGRVKRLNLQPSSLSPSKRVRERPRCVCAGDRHGGQAKAREQQRMHANL